MQASRVSISRFPLLAAGLQIGAWLTIVGLYTVTYVTHNPSPVLTSLEIPLTYGLFSISGIGGGGLALVGIYRLLAYPRHGIGTLILLIVSGLSLLWAEICLYALLLFMAAI